MSRASYLAYGERARLMSDPLKASARLVMRRAQERLIVPDIIRKLDLGPTDRLLDIGCGIGSLTIPLSFLVADTMGVDHPECVARLKRRLPEDNIRTLGGNWFDVELRESFTRILVYSVIQYLSNIEEVRRFVEKALGLLEAGGAMLIGDVPSQGFDDRFNSTAVGNKYNSEWNRSLGQSISEEAQILKEMDIDTAAHLLHPDTETFHFTDATLLQFLLSLRAAGFDAYVLPQEGDLPFVNKREDILVRRPR